MPDELVTGQASDNQPRWLLEQLVCGHRREDPPSLWFLNR